MAFYFLRIIDDRSDFVPDPYLMRTTWIAYVLLIGSSLPAQAFTDGVFGIGAGYFSENAMSKIAQKETGQTGFMGEPSLPIALRYDYGVGMTGWFLAPQLMYSLLPRKTAGSHATVTLTHLVFALGQNFSSMGGSGSGWDWSVGPGLLMRDIKGKGGTTEMSNGTGTATFAVPGRSTSVKLITTNLGVSWTYVSSRVAADLVIERLLASKERTQSFFFSYLYQFGGRGF